MRSDYVKITVPGLLVIITLLLPANLSAGSNEDHQGSFFYGLYIGVDLGLVNQFEGSPLVGYEFAPWLNGGIGAKYQYYYDKRINSVFRTHIYGPAAFLDFIPIQNLNDLFSFNLIEGALFVHAEANLFSLSAEYFDKNNEYSGRKRFFRPTWLAGLGLRRQAGQNSYFHILLMIDVSADNPKVYSNPVLRFGFMF